MNNVLITGGLGFIGSNLTLRCLELGYKVVVIDNCSSGSTRHNNVFRDYPHYRFYKEDICDTEKMTELFRDIDVVFHMAAIPRVQQSTDFPIETNQSNITGTLSVLEAARKVGVKRVVYSASSSMYGGSDIPFPTPETTPAHPKSNYALQKYVGLEYCRLYSELYGLDTVSLIYYNVFGVGQQFGGSYSTCITAFFHAAFNNYPCRIDGGGEQSRDLTYVDNVVQANLLAANHPTKLMGQAFNIACGETYTVNEVFEEVQSLMGKELEKQHAPARLGDPRKSLANISKAKSVLGYEPKVGFKDGMKLTYEWWLKGDGLKNYIIIGDKKYYGSIVKLKSHVFGSTNYIDFEAFIPHGDFWEFDDQIGVLGGFYHKDESGKEYFMVPEKLIFREK